MEIVHTTVDEVRLAYREAGGGRPVVFLHGNPTSSYLWRDVIPPVSTLARCVAPDLAGMGSSGTSPDNRYRFVDHRRYVEAFLEALDLTSDVILVGHDWRGKLTDDELAEYRAPYVEPGESRRPMLTWAREIPIDGMPSDVHAIVAANAEWMAASRVPKLFINGDPGALLNGPLREQCRRWPNQREVTVPGLHFLPEDSAAAIAAALLDWIPTC